jgi:glycerophosphoryl diester phosphodiesterase
MPVLERPSASLAAYLPGLRQIVVVGDCQVLVDGQHYVSPQASEPLVAEQRAQYFLHQLSLGYSMDELLQHHQSKARELIRPALERAAELRNQADHPLSYSVMDGTPIPWSLVQVVQVPEGCHTIVLATDGYPELFPTLAQTEAHLQSLLRQDPLCIGALRGCKGVEPGNLSFDDRSYISLAVA